MPGIYYTVDVSLELYILVIIKSSTSNESVCGSDGAECADDDGNRQLTPTPGIKHTRIEYILIILNSIWIDSTTTLLPLLFFYQVFSACFSCELRLF